MAGLLLATLLFARMANAEEDEGLRIGAAAVGSYGSLHRSATREREVDGVTLGGELRVHRIRSPHGFVVAYTDAEGAFGPVVEIIDAGYSYRIAGPSRLDGLTGALYADVGPAIGFVRDASPARDHTVLGTRTSLAADAQLWNFTVGLIVAYRAGVPLSGTRDAWEGAFTFGLRVGLVLDVH